MIVMFKCFLIIFCALILNIFQFGLPDLITNTESFVDSEEFRKLFNHLND